MKKAGIIGGSGYTGGELLRILMHHPDVCIDFVYSRTYAGKPVAHVHPDLTGGLNLEFTDSVNEDADVVFLCLGHGNSIDFLSKHEFSKSTKIIDLSNDYRPTAENKYKDWVYGLTELNKEDIPEARMLANPGCFATAIQLALIPLASHNLLNADIHVNAITGSTGAGSATLPTTQFSWRNNNISWYKPFTHQHLGEINATLAELQPGHGHLYFIPQRGNFTRGIMATAYTKFDGVLEEAHDIFRNFYKDCAFVKVVDEPVHLKQVVNTNYCHLHLHKYKDVILVTSVLDNLLKGASGQAVQNMNLMLGCEEATALNLKASVF